jgi:hypothetical protein
VRQAVNLPGGQKAMHWMIGKPRISARFAQEGKASRSEAQLLAEFMMSHLNG